MPLSAQRRWVMTRTSDQEQSSQPATSATPEEGVVIRAFGKFFNVQLTNRPVVLLSTVRGSLKRHRRHSDLVAVGDRVLVTDVGEGEGRIESVLPRTRVLARPARLSTDTEQVILANPDQALFVFSLHNPEPHRRMLDRFLLLAASQDLPAAIAINKVDLDPAGADAALDRFADYTRHYTLFPVSVKTGQGIDAIRAWLEGKVTVVAGPSGVGKSSLLNRLHPGLQRLVGEVSEATGKGRHTTIAAEIQQLAPGTFIADTPGMRSLTMDAIPGDDLPSLFPEFGGMLGECRYADCRHLTEPGCSIRDAVDAGEIARERYESYAALRRGEPDPDPVA